MNEFKSWAASRPQDSGEAGPRADSAESPRVRPDLPISNWDDYKSWCEKVKENWDAN